MIKSRRMRWARYIACVGELRSAFKILVGKPEGKRQIVRSRSTWEDNIKIDLREIGSETVNWIHLAQGRDQRRALANTAMNLWVP
jgi:hypothetical protein